MAEDQNGGGGDGGGGGGGVEQLMEDVKHNARGLAQAKVCQNDANRRASGRDKPEVKSLNDRARDLKNQLYIWMFNRDSICSYTSFRPNYPPNAPEGYYYANFTWKFTFSPQTAFWVQAQLHELFKPNSVYFDQAFEFHLANVYSQCTFINKADFFRRLLFDTVYNASVSIETKFDIGTRNPNAAMVVKRMRDDNADLEGATMQQNDGIQYICGPNGDRVRVESMNIIRAPDQRMRDKQQANMMEKRRRNVMLYYITDKFDDHTKKKNETILAAELAYVCHRMGGNVLDQSFAKIKSEVLCVPPPAVMVTPRAILEASQRMYKPDKLAELQRELNMVCREVTKLEEDVLNYQPGTLLARIIPVDRIDAENQDEKDWRVYFVAVLNEYISVKAELDVVKLQSRTEASRERVSAENLIQTVDPETDPYGYWSRHYDDKDQLEGMRDLIKTAFEGNLLAHEATDGDHGESILTLGCLTELGNSVQVKVEYARPMLDTHNVMPKKTLKWDQYMKAVNRALNTVSEKIRRPLIIERLNNSQAATREVVGEDLITVWNEMVQAGLFGEVMSEVARALITMEAPREPLKVAPVTKEGEKRVIMAP